MMKKIVLCCVVTMMTGFNLFSSWVGLGSRRAVKVAVGSGIAAVVSGVGACRYQDHVQSEQKRKEMEQKRQKQESQLELEKMRRIEAERRACNQRFYNDWINKNIGNHVASEQKPFENNDRSCLLGFQSGDLYLRDEKLNKRQRVLDWHRKEMESRQAQQANRSKISELLK